MNPGETLTVSCLKSSRLMVKVGCLRVQWIPVELLINKLKWPWILCEHKSFQAITRILTWDHGFSRDYTGSYVLTHTTAALTTYCQTARKVRFEDSISKKNVYWREMGVPIQFVITGSDSCSLSIQISLRFQSTRNIEIPEIGTIYALIVLTTTTHLSLWFPYRHGFGSVYARGLWSWQLIQK